MAACVCRKANSGSPSSSCAQALCKVWLFTLGPAGGASPGGTRVAEVGPLPPVAAPQYLLRINEASGPPGSITAGKRTGNPSSLLPGADSSGDRLCWRFTHVDHVHRVSLGAPRALEQLYSAEATALIRDMREQIRPSRRAVA